MSRSTYRYCQRCASPDSPEGRDGQRRAQLMKRLYTRVGGVNTPMGHICPQGHVALDSRSEDMPATKCGRCGGTVLNDALGEDKCVNCGRVPAQANGRGPERRVVEVAVVIRPGDLAELLHGLAAARGQTAVEFLEGTGLSRGQARAMARGSAVYPETLLDLVQGYGITPADLWTLLEAQAQANRAATR